MATMPRSEGLQKKGHLRMKTKTTIPNDFKNMNEEEYSRSAILHGGIWLGIRDDE
jgi:hypothetical protein